MIQGHIHLKVKGQKDKGHGANARSQITYTCSDSIKIAK